MKSGLVIITAVLFCSVVPAATFKDDFNRDGRQNMNPAVSIGADYATRSTTAENPVFSIDRGMLKITGGGAARQILLYPAKIKTESGNGKSFTISGDVKTIPMVAATALYGLAFNIQEDGTFYTLRMNTRNDNLATIILMLLDETGKQIAATVLTTVPLELSSVYHLEVSSSTPGVFDYIVNGPKNSSFSGTADLSKGRVLHGGHGGFYLNVGNANVSFDNLMIKAE